MKRIKNLINNNLFGIFVTFISAVAVFGIVVLGIIEVVNLDEGLASKIITIAVISIVPTGLWGMLMSMVWG